MTDIPTEAELNYWEHLLKVYEQRHAMAFAFEAMPSFIAAAREALRLRAENEKMRRALKESLATLDAYNLRFDAYHLAKAALEGKVQP